ncbi:AMP-binding protein [Arcanobacterium haemolyticum]|nr:AMP-binding protein [Arcanobacterium haemolyticum]
MSSRSMPEYPVRVIVCDGSEFADVVDHVRLALTGQAVPPLFVVGPQVDPIEAAAEIAAQGYPVNTGVLMRTSGSTSGTGTIIALSWDSLVASANATHTALAGPGPWLADLPLHHIAGFQTIVRSVLAECEPLHTKLEQLLTAPITHHPTYCSIVPTQLVRILDHLEHFPAARHVTFLVGGAATSSELLERAQAAGLTVHTSYGMTETCGGCVYDGRPIGDAAITLGTDGAIVITGSLVRLGSAENAHGQRTHRTRDLGIFGPDGRLSVLGRIDDAITTGGLTIVPRLVEESLAAAAHSTAIVVGVPDATWGEAAIALIDPWPENITEQQLRDHVKHALGTGWQPQHVLPLTTIGFNAWPLTQSGKIDRRAIRNATHVYFSGGNS